MLSICIAHSARSTLQWRGRLISLFPRCVDSLCRAAAELRGPFELIVADYPLNRDAGPPLADWLPRACTIPARIIEMAGTWDKGAALNAAAAAASGDVLFFLDCDFLVPAEVLRRGTLYAAQGLAWFPGYLCQTRPGGKFSRLPHRMGCGNMIVSRTLFDQFGGWLPAPGRGMLDIPAGNWFAERGLSVESVVYREPVPGFVHLWHPKHLGWKKMESTC